MLSLFILMSMGSIAVLILTVTKVSDSNIKTTKSNLDMLNTAMFQSLRNAMNTGDPAQIIQAEDEARGIKGVKKLIIAKSKPLIEMYSPGGAFTTDTAILKSFDTKKEQVIEIDDESGHSLRMVKPMVATKDCLMCHANQAEGDIIGIMDLTFSLAETDKQLDEITLNILITSTILGWLTIGIVFFVIRKTISPIEGLRQGFENLIESNDTSIKLKASSNDEIGEVAKLFNKYMDQVNAGLKQDEIVINETNDILQKTANGFFVYEVTSTASNPHVEAMRKNLNFMIKKVKGTLDKINVTLRNYSQSRYDYKIDDNDIYGDLGAVTAGIKLVGNNTSEMLAMIMNTGDNLNSNTHTLSDSASGLSTSSNTQAASLEETAAALEEMTTTIKGNTKNSSKMAQLAQSVTTSANDGEKLANSTSIAMDDIVKQVSSINEAIEVIDQIAFQTNILSLNAAVEAATAGEAGKGFAVVAQEVRNLASRSAEAAKDIKDIVEQATSKANNGKSIADNMIEGYKQLNDNINSTISLIDEVSKSSEEQQHNIVQINDAVIQIDGSTQENAAMSNNISSMSNDIKLLSDRLVTAASKASFLQETRTQVCDIDLIYEIANLKVALFDYKDDVYSRLADKTDVVVREFSELNQWMDKHERVGTNFIKTSNWSILKQVQQKIHICAQNYINQNTKQIQNSVLKQLSQDIENTSLDLFDSLDMIKTDHCKEKKKI